MIATCCLITVLKGAVMFVTDLARAIPLPTQFEFMAVSSYGSSTSSSGVGADPQRPRHATSTDRDVLIVEDVVDSGLTPVLVAAQTWANPASALAAGCARCCAKPDALRANTEIAYVGFDIPNEFVGRLRPGLRRALPRPALHRIPWTRGLPGLAVAVHGVSPVGL